MPKDSLPPTTPISLPANPMAAAAATQAANPWSATPVAAKPFILDHLRRCCKNNIIAGTVTLVAVPIITVVGYEPFVRHVDDLRAYLLALFFIIGAPIWAITALVKNVKWSSNPYSHPALTWPEVGVPQQIVDSIDTEIASTEHHERIGPALFTASWLLRYTNWSIEAVPLANIAWAYKHVTVTRTYGIQTGKTYSLHLYARNGKLFQLANVSENQVNEILRSINQRAPWAILGFNQQLKNAWSKNRASVLGTVDQRREEYLRQRAAAAAAAEAPAPSSSPDSVELAGGVAAGPVTDVDAAAATPPHPISKFDL